MAQIQAKTVYDDLLDKLNGIFSGLTYYLDKSNLSMQLMLLKRDCESLAKASRIESDASFIVYHSLFGDVEMMRRHYDNAVSLGAKNKVLNIYIHGLWALGFFTEALLLAIENLTPTSGMFGENYTYITRNGGHKTVLQYFEECKSMNMNIEMAEKDSIQSNIVANILDEEDLQDHDLAKYMDVAGEVARKHRIFLSNQAMTHTLIRHDDETFYEIQFLINEDPEFVACLNMELAEKLAASDVIMPTGLNISFRCL